MGEPIEKSDVASRAVTGTFQTTMQVTQQRTLVMTGHVYSDDTIEEVHQRVDFYQAVIERQYVRCDITNLEAQKKAQMAGIIQFRDQLEALKIRQDAKHSALKLSSQEKLALQNGEQTIINAEKNINLLDEQIAVARKKIEIAA